MYSTLDTYITNPFNDQFPLLDCGEMQFFPSEISNLKNLEILYVR